MIRNFTLEFWIDDGWYIGRLKEVPGVFSQGETLEELEKNIKDAYEMVMKETEPIGHKKLNFNIKLHNKNFDKPGFFKKPGLLNKLVCSGLYLLLGNISGKLISLISVFNFSFIFLN